MSAIQKKDIDQIKGYNRPPDVALVIMEACSIMLTGKSGEWQTHRVMLQRMDEFIESLRNFPRDNIPEDRLRRIRTIISKPLLEEKNVERSVPVALHILRWVKSMEEYARLAEEYRPKKAKVDKLQAQYDEANADLKEKEAVLEEARAKVQSLTDQARQLTIQQNELEQRKELIKARKHRAGQLFTLTKDEAIRWKESVDKLFVEIENLLGDVFVSVGCLSYSGPFTGNHRRSMVETWAAQVIEKGIPIS